MSKLTAPPSIASLKRFLLLSDDKAPAQKILEEKHAIHVQIFHQEKSFQDLLRTAVTCDG
jgi:hypothetical protein